MISPQITDSLHRIFGSEDARVVIWQDAAREFDADLADLALTGVEVLRLDQLPALEVKMIIEAGISTGRYLIYAPFEEPEPEQDWLLDIRLYGRSFRADTASILLDELGLIHHAMRSHLIVRQKFLRSKERVDRLKKWVAPADTGEAIDRKMLAVVTRAEQPDVFVILTRLYGALGAEDTPQNFRSLKFWQDMEALDMVEAFWTLVQHAVGYDQLEPDLMDLLYRLMVTDLFVILQENLPEALRHFVLPNKSLHVTVTIFLAQWRNHLTASVAYDRLAGLVASELKIGTQLEGVDPTDLTDAMTFEEVEKAILRAWRDQVIQQGADIRLAELRDTIQRRRDGHWARPARVEDHGAPYLEAYKALEAAAQLAVLQGTWSAGFAFATPVDAAQAYVHELYQFDQLYRHFHEAADIVELANWDLLKTLRTTVEAIYTDWYIPHLATAWGRFMAGEEGLLTHWHMTGFENQYRFYHRHVRPVISTPRSRVFVLISDAFRYEAAAELVSELNGKYRFQATLGAMLGVLPSYTALGMAALLPHKQLGYEPNGDVLVDGKSTAGLERRDKVLNGHHGVAIKAEDLLAMNKDAGREFVKPYRVVYIYHNQVDAVGDMASTESHTFAAVRKAIQDLGALLRFIINSLNGTTVLVTADHGFLYQDTPLEGAEKSALEVKPKGVVSAKKRYLYGPVLDPAESPKAWCGNTHDTAHTEPGMAFWVPKGANRFHLVGGARFSHGGAMPQEILVPVITVRELEGKAAESTVARKVDVSLLGSSRKIVNNVQRFEFIQNDAISDRVQPRTLLISLRDGGTPVSTETSVTFASDSDHMDARKQTVQLTIKGGQYDRTKPYALVLIDAESKAEVDRIPFTIDLAFTNDF